MNQIAKFPEFCPAFHGELGPSDGDNPLFIGLSKAGRLHAANRSGSTMLATNANSFYCASGFVIYVTLVHEAHFIPIRELFSVPSASYSGERRFESEIRRVERGSRIVTAVSSNMALVLQMPRGNLETVNPRPLVLEVVKKNVDGCLFSFLLHSKLLTGKPIVDSGARRSYRVASIASISMFSWNMIRTAFFPISQSLWDRSMMSTTSTFS